MKFRLVILIVVLIAFLKGTSFGDEPRPMGLTLGESTIEDVIDEFKKRKAKEVFQERAYVFIYDTQVGSRVGIIPQFLSKNFPSHRLVEIKDLSSVVAYNIPSLGKDSFIFAYFLKNKLFYINYHIPMIEENSEVVKKTLETLQKKYRLRGLPNQIVKIIESGVKRSVGLSDVKFSNPLVATYNNKLVGVSTIEENGKRFLKVEYGDIILYETVFNQAKEIYKRNFESLF